MMKSKKGEIMSYKNLGIISIIFRVLGWAVIILGLVVTGMVASAIEGTTATLVIALAGLLGVVLLSALLFTFAHLIPLIINIEENTMVAARGCPDDGTCKQCQDFPPDNLQ